MRRRGKFFPHYTTGGSVNWPLSQSAWQRFMETSSRPSRHSDTYHLPVQRSGAASDETGQLPALSAHSFPTGHIRANGSVPDLLGFPFLEPRWIPLHP